MPVLLALSLAPQLAKSYSMRLNLPVGKTFSYRLLVDRENPKESGELTIHYKISKVELGTTYMDASFTKLRLNGMDRTKDLRATVGNQTVTMPWTIYSRRTGSMTPLHMNPIKADIMPMLGEAGIYLAFFQKQDVRIGESWRGSTTATGGCTSAKYTLNSVKTVNGKKLAYFDVTDIAFLNPSDSQIGPMKMIVDLSTGLPTVVDYKVKNEKTGRVSHFRQTEV